MIPVSFFAHINPSIIILLLTQLLGYDNLRPFLLPCLIRAFPTPGAGEKNPCPSGFGFVPGPDGPLFVFSFAVEFLVSGGDLPQLLTLLVLCHKND